MKSSKAELLRMRYKYREFILKGKLKVPLSVAKKLLGPDTAYHLYSQLKNSKDDKGEGGKSS